MASKPQIRLKSKAQADEKAQSARVRWRMSILKRFATQLLGLRWGFETTSKLYADTDFLNAACAPDRSSTNFFKLNWSPTSVEYKQLISVLFLFKQLILY